ncbi:MAG: hypothetical protein L3J94_04810 [Gammaproteobacteria bacterium]|nr:hypothetical protein [Gammaproteobacteria bacterium]
MDKTFLLTGGLERRKNANHGDGRGFESAKLLRLNMNSKTLTDLVVLDDAKINYPDESPNFLFTAATLDGDSLWLCTETEIFEYSYPELKLKRTASYPCFQNVHHVTPIGTKIGVVSTGLDLVAILSRETLALERVINVEDKDPWHRYDSTVDYRKIHSTKPHDCHPNFLLYLNNSIWVTRLVQKDVVNLEDFTQKIDIGGAGIHDGHLIGDFLYFTCVYGEIVIVDVRTFKVVERVDLKQIEGVNRPLGWCRGLAIEKNVAYVAFSHLRPTKVKENISWTRDILSGRSHITKTRIVAYDLEKKCKIDEFILPPGSINAIYSIICEPTQNK